MSVLWLNGNCPAIPEIDDVELERLMQLMKPVARFGEDKWLHTIMPVNPRNVAFTWDPSPAEKLTDAFEVARIETYHTCGYIACFKPTITEVLAQIPKHLIDETEFFETLKGDCVGCFSQGDGHRTVTILYSSSPSWKRIERALEKRRNAC